MPRRRQTIAEQHGYECNFTIEQLIRKIRRLVRESPDNRFGEDCCAYATGRCDNGAHGCLIGQAFAALGVPTPLLVAWDECSGDIHWVIEDELGLSPQPKQLQWISALQYAQDRSMPWREALARAHRSIAPAQIGNDLETASC